MLQLINMVNQNRILILFALLLLNSILIAGVNASPIPKPPNPNIDENSDITARIAPKSHKTA